jgi:hypothetical protein
MIETLTVSLTGPAFSFLLYENMKSKFCQEGFLIGHLVEKETKTITDNDQQQIHLQRIIRINCAVPCPQPFYFYDAIGRVDTEKVKTFLGDLAPKVIAWYKYKPASSFNFTFRERIIHKQLSTLFNVPPEFFTCCLMIGESSDNNSTHTHTQTFVRYLSHSYEQLPMHIVNLSDTHNAYKSPEQPSDTFLDIVRGLNINFKKAGGTNVVTKIQNALQKHIESTVENLAEAEKKLFQLESEVRNINNMVKNKDHTSASNNKESQLNDLIMMDTDPTDSPINSPTKATPRGRGKSNTPRSGKRNSQSPAKKTTPGGREIVTRSKKKI